MTKQQLADVLAEANEVFESWYGVEELEDSHHRNLVLLGYLATAHVNTQLALGRTVQEVAVEVSGIMAAAFRMGKAAQ